MLNVLLPKQDSFVSLGVGKTAQAMGWRMFLVFYLKSNPSSQVIVGAAYSGVFSPTTNKRT
jgi:hypothetical protein